MKYATHIYKALLAGTGLTLTAATFSTTATACDWQPSVSNAELGETYLIPAQGGKYMISTWGGLNGTIQGGYSYDGFTADQAGTMLGEWRREALTDEDETFGHNYMLSIARQSGKSPGYEHQNTADLDPEADHYVHFDFEEDKPCGAGQFTARVSVTVRGFLGEFGNSQRLDLMINERPFRYLSGDPPINGEYMGTHFIPGTEGGEYIVARQEQAKNGGTDLWSLQRLNWRRKGKVDFVKVLEFLQTIDPNERANKFNIDVIRLVQESAAKPGKVMAGTFRINDIVIPDLTLKSDAIAPNPYPTPPPLPRADMAEDSYVIRTYNDPSMVMAVGDDNTLVTQAYTGEDNQQFLLIDAGGDNYNLAPASSPISGVDSGHVPVDNAAVTLSDAQRGWARQKWQLVASDRPNAYFVDSAKGDTDIVIETPDPVPTENEPLVLRSINGLDRQKWTFEPVAAEPEAEPETVSSHTRFAIQNKQTLRFMDTAGGTDASQTRNGSVETTFWRIVPYADDKFRLVSDDSPRKILMISDGEVVLGNPGDAPTNMTMWRKVPVEGTEDGTFHIVSAHPDHGALSTARGRDLVVLDWDAGGFKTQWHFIQQD